MDRGVSDAYIVILFRQFRSLKSYKFDSREIGEGQFCVYFKIHLGGKFAPKLVYFVLRKELLNLSQPAPWSQNTNKPINC